MFKLIEKDSNLLSNFATDLRFSFASLFIHQLSPINFLDSDFIIAVQFATINLSYWIIANFAVIACLRFNCWSFVNSDLRLKIKKDLENLLDLLYFNFFIELMVIN